MIAMFSQLHLNQFASLFLLLQHLCVCQDPATLEGVSKTVKWECLNTADLLWSGQEQTNPERIRMETWRKFWKLHDCQMS